MTLTESSLLRLRRPCVACGILGQSNEAGNVQSSELATYPLAFKSAIDPSVQVPFGPNLGTAGSWWPRVYDTLYNWGYDLKFVNGAVGSLSFLKQVTNYPQGRNNNFAYYAKRSPSGLAGDRGDQGDFILVGTRVFQCTTGRTRIAINTSQFLDAQGSTKHVGVVLSGTQTSAGSEPAGLSTANVGDTVTDNTVVWTCVATDLTGAYANTLGTAKVFTAFQEGYGFDPLGVLQRLFEAMQAERNVDRRIVYIQNGQGDLGTSSATYSNVLISIASFFLNRGMEVMIGLTHFSPGASGGTTGNYDLLSAGRDTAIASLQASYPGLVHAGANLYSSMGSTGPMASAGAFLQGDNVHLNGAGSVGADNSGISSAYRYVSDALKAVLPQLVT